jgi:hypothetical protein
MHQKLEKNRLAPPIRFRENAVRCEWSHNVFKTDCSHRGDENNYKAYTSQHKEGR